MISFDKWWCLNSITWCFASGCTLAFLNLPPTRKIFFLSINGDNDKILLLHVILLCDNKFASSSGNDWCCAIFINVSRPLCVSLVLSWGKFPLPFPLLFHIIQLRFNFKIQLIWPTKFGKDEEYVQFISISLLLPPYFDFVIMFASLIFIKLFWRTGLLSKVLNSKACKTNSCYLSNVEIPDIL